MACTESAASEFYADFITRSYISSGDPGELPPDSCTDIINSQFSVVYLPLEPLLPLSFSRYSYSGIPKLYSLLDSTAMEASGILSAFRSPALGNQGQGVLMGFVDTGIDYENPLFRNPDGTTRIEELWDQTEGSGTGFDDTGFSALYGTRYTASRINDALRSGDPHSLVPESDSVGHGTFLASIAAGGISEESEFIGAAPRAALAVVKLKPAKQYLRDFYLIREDAEAYQENDIMMGISFLLDLARRLGRPLVLCLGLGTSQGSHDGKGPLGLYLESVSNIIGVCIVTAAGNETGFGHHYMGMPALNREYEDVELRVAEKERGFSMELWAYDAEVYSVGFVTPTGEVVERLPAAPSGENRLTFLLEKTEITVFFRAADIITGSQLIFMRFSAPTPGIWHIRVYNSLRFQGQFHIWLPCRGFISDSTYFLSPDPNTTLTDPGNAQLPITATAYNHRNRSLYIHASRGYTRSGLMKPDLAAPGVDVQGASLSRLQPMTRMTGTSAAAAFVAGAAAVLMSWGIVERNDLFMTTSVIKTILTRGAERNPALPYPNREFGYGTLDLYQSFLTIRS